MIDFEGQMLSSTQQVKEELLELREMMVERQIHKVVEVKPKKIYRGVIIETKMMSEEEVKEEKYNVHFLKMVRLFDLISDSFLNNFNDHALLTSLWKNLMKKILGVTNHPEHRLSVLKLVKKSCLYTAYRSQGEKESTIFLRHA